MEIRNRGAESSTAGNGFPAVITDRGGQPDLFRGGPAIVDRVTLSSHGFQDLLVFGDGFGVVRTGQDAAIEQAQHLPRREGGEEHLHGGTVRRVVPGADDCRVFDLVPP